MSNFDKILKDFHKCWIDQLDKKKHIATGTLASDMSWDTYIDTKGYHITITLPEYATYLDKGTKPHWPPVDKIKEWIRVKPILPRPMKGGKLPTTDQLAYLIGRKINKVGTKPTNIIMDTITYFDLIDKLANAVDEQLRKEFEQ